MMTSEPKVALTQRAYTLRLRGIDPKDNSWRDALWATHEAVNKGAKAFGDWLLTLRGGLDHKPASGENVGEQRVVLALCWLSVEDETHAPADFNLAPGSEPQSVRDEKVVVGLRDILSKRGLAPTQIDEWVDDCRASLCSAIRDDAVWVNRSAAFDAGLQLPGLTREHARKVLEIFVGDIARFLALPAGDDRHSSGETQQEDESKDFVTKASGWLSFNCGEDEKSDKKKIADTLTEIVNAPLDDLVGKAGTELPTRLCSLLQIPHMGDRARDLKAIRGRVG